MVLAAGWQASVPAQTILTGHCSRPDISSDIILSYLQTCCNNPVIRLFPGNQMSQLGLQTGCNASYTITITSILRQGIVVIQVHIDERSSGDGTQCLPLPLCGAQNRACGANTCWSHRTEIQNYREGNLFRRDLLGVGHRLKTALHNK